MIRISRLILTGVVTALLLGWGSAVAQEQRPSGGSKKVPLVPSELQIYLNARSVVNESESELIARIPELKDVDFATGQDELLPLLQKVGEVVAALFEDFPNTSSVEQVRQRRSSNIARTWDEISQKCVYLISVKQVDSELRVEEYRSNDKGKPLEPSWQQRSFMLTSGYVSESLIFHPMAQSGATFRLVGRQRKDPGLLLVAYAQRPEAPKLAGRLQINEASAVILLQGMAWIDPSTYRIVRLWSDLLVPRSDFGIKSHITETEFHEVRFEHIPHPFWLPSQVEVVVKWGGYTYANRHRYSDYKVFSVDAQDGEKKLAKP